MHRAWGHRIAKQVTVPDLVGSATKLGIALSRIIVLILGNTFRYIESLEVYAFNVFS